MKQKILVALENKSIVKKLIELAGDDIKIIEAVPAADKVSSGIHKVSPDFVICDSNVSGGGATTLLYRHTFNVAVETKFIFIGSKNKMLERLVEETEASILLTTPITAKSIMDTINILIMNGKGMCGRALQKKITDTIHMLGVPAHIKGYSYIRKAIELAVNDDSYINGLTTKLYPTLSEIFDTKPARVERAIRSAIETAWDRGDTDILQDLFGYTVSSDKGKPTNGEFLSLITDNIKLGLI